MTQQPVSMTQQPVSMTQQPVAMTTKQHPVVGTPVPYNQQRTLTQQSTAPEMQMAGHSVTHQHGPNISVEAGTPSESSEMTPFSKEVFPANTQLPTLTKPLFASTVVAGNVGIFPSAGKQTLEISLESLIPHNDKLSESSNERLPIHATQNSHNLQDKNLGQHFSTTPMPLQPTVDNPPLKGHADKPFTTPSLFDQPQLSPTPMYEKHPSPLPAYSEPPIPRELMMDTPSLTIPRPAQMDTATPSPGPISVPHPAQMDTPSLTVPHSGQMDPISVPHTAQMDTATPSPGPISVSLQSSPASNIGNCPPPAPPSLGSSSASSLIDPLGSRAASPQKAQFTIFNDYSCLFDDSDESDTETSPSRGQESEKVTVTPPTHSPDELVIDTGSEDFPTLVSL
eukprot:sb/3465436/